MAFGAHSGKQLSPLTENMGSRLKWWHKIDDPTIQILTAEGSVFAELSWPERVRHQGSPAVGQSADSEYNFRKESTARGAVSILSDGADVGKVIAVIGRPSTIALSNGQNYTLRNEGFLREDWVLVDGNGEPLFRVKRISPDVEVSGEVELLGEGMTKPPMLLLLMAAWYAVQ